MLISMLTACSGVRKNWKVTKNTVTILQNKDIKIAQHIYGTPNQKISTKTGKTIYIWGVEGSKLQTVQTKTVSSEKGNQVFQSLLDYGYNCYLAFKTNEAGTILEGIQIGFEPDGLSAGCRQLFLRSYKFCSAVKEETQKETGKTINSCYRSDYSEKKYGNFIIPKKYQEMYYYQEDHDINNFFND